MDGDCRINWFKLKASVKTLIVLNQTDDTAPAEDYDFIIGVDGGCRWCIENNLKIDLAVGDFDSLENHHFEQLTKIAGKIEQHPSEKNLTDFELAIEAVLDQSPKELTVLGVWGGRTDHALANLLCLARQSNLLPVTMPGEKQSGYLLKSGYQIVIEYELDQTVSIMALLNDCHGVSNTGMKYPLTDASIPLGTGIGISNQTVTNPASISLNDGVLLVLTDKHSDNRIIT